MSKTTKQKWDTRTGTFKNDEITIHYWSEYRNDWKTMYFRIEGIWENLKPIKGLRRNNELGYYTARVVGPFASLMKIVEAYSEQESLEEEM